MLNKTYLFLLILFINFSVSSQNTFIPDDNFEQALIDLGFDAGLIDNFIPTANISGIANLEIYSRNISDLTGIEDFTALSYLNCSDNLLTSIDVSNNLNLTRLVVKNNQLTTLDIAKNLLLTDLSCHENQITSLDITQNVLLSHLNTDGNPLKVLDVTNNVNLTTLNCQNNQLTNLDITNNPLLSLVFCDYNFLTGIDTSNNVELETFYGGDNLISSFDLSKNIKLKNFWCVRNQLSELDVTHNINLEHLNFSQNTVFKIDLSNNAKLVRLVASRNQLSTLDTSNNTELVDLFVVINGLTSLDLSNNKKLEKLYCLDNLLCFINIQNGNNNIITHFDSSLNPFLGCIFVDDLNYSTTNWTNIDPVTNFVLTQDQCDATGHGIPDVDMLNDYTGTSFTLPPLLKGTYHTETNAGGQQLIPGEVITTSQTIYIFSSTQCYTNESSFNVIIGNNYFIPKYFTPNNDGENDTWKVIDNSDSFTSITIHNRFGKLLKYLNSNKLEWDGTFNGELMATDDYWYVINRVSGVPIKGHFTLKR